MATIDSLQGNSPVQTDAIASVAEDTKAKFTLPSNSGEAINLMIGDGGKPISKPGGDDPLSVDSLVDSPQDVSKYPNTAEGAQQRVNDAVSGLQSSFGELQDALKTLESFNSKTAGPEGTEKGDGTPETQGKDAAEKAEKANEAEETENDEQTVLLKLLLLLLRMLGDKNIPQEMKDEIKALLPQLAKNPQLQELMGGAMGTEAGKP
ncbi:hypothetical protein [Thalassococcus sp. S3]|uniref:hypothetical protein n=1 Tax=Thalassococcus sp. S3 TaxID=2017482 RepID=UPI00102469B7|nr:hypothetical protein [Thalassococcus sp. S3]QBF33414.1 hypothetical protein CFI11_19680 [Thalassococcus sp. S3]